MTLVEHRSEACPEVVHSRVCELASYRGIYWHGIGRRIEQLVVALVLLADVPQCIGGTWTISLVEANDVCYVECSQLLELRWRAVFLCSHIDADVAHGRDARIPLSDTGSLDDD